MRGGHGDLQWGATLLSAAALLAACATASPSPGAASASLQVVPSISPSPPAATPSDTLLPFPAMSEVELVPGRYDSSPPFDYDFTFAIPEPGWHTAHIHGEFFDVMRFDGPDPRNPTHWVAWAHPTTIHGDSDEPASELTPRGAADLMSTQLAVDAGPISAFTFGGLSGVQLDLHTEIQRVPLFGGPDGDFQLDSSHDLRAGIVERDGDLLLVLCLAAAQELDTACARAQPILDSVRW